MAKLERDRSLAERITRNAAESFQNVAGCSGINSTENYLVRLADTQERLQEALRALVDVRDEITRVIQEVDDLDAQTVLVRHYLAYENIDTIADKMHYDRRTIQRKHNQALEQVVIECHPKLC